MKNKDIEIEELRASVDDLKTLLENETLCKVDYQNNLQSLNEELSFRKKIYEEVSQVVMISGRGVVWCSSVTERCIFY